ncbi:MAG TPA: glycosyltransferase family 1 protein [Vicinamibacterales bacterium]|nr:glycosyltransferase family 1 protein [Vicinamibacterales bacterium]
MRVVIDYRSALRERSGVGEYTHQLARALVARRDPALEVTIFSSSWKDRLERPADLAGANAVDRRVPVRLLNLSWHRLGWPPVESLTGREYDVAHSLHPLLMPSRRAAQVITIHDLNFLSHPERTRGEVRRDYVALAATHAQRADRIVVVSEFTAGEAVQKLGVPRERISVCLVGAPDWPPLAERAKDGYVLFFGTLEPRKNVGGLLDAYELLSARLKPSRSFPELVLAGKETADARQWLERIARPPLAGHVRHIGYVDPSRRRELYAGARLLVLPSFDEGFGIPVLEAMTLGVPVVAANRGALPEVLGDAGILVDPEQPASIADAIAKMLTDETFASQSIGRGLARARTFSWTASAGRLVEAYALAVENRKRSCASA